MMGGSIDNIVRVLAEREELAGGWGWWEVALWFLVLAIAPALVFGRYRRALFLQYIFINGFEILSRVLPHPPNGYL